MAVLLVAQAYRERRAQSAHKEQQVPKEFKGHWDQLV